MMIFLDLGMCDYLGIYFMGCEGFTISDFVIRMDRREMYFFFDNCYLRRVLI